MKKIMLLVLTCAIIVCCKINDDMAMSEPDDIIQEIPQTPNCSDIIFPQWTSSDYVLPYPVGVSYPVGLSACTTSYHSVGSPDQFAIDFNMPIGSAITASTDGKVVHIVESGNDYGFPNNLVVVRNNEGYVQYMHLTKDGAEVEVGDDIVKGELIGYSGATGLAGYPHLHFVVTTAEGWPYPYDSAPVTFSNTIANPYSLESGKTYTAEDY